MAVALAIGWLAVAPAGVLAQDGPTPLPPGYLVPYTPLPGTPKPTADGGSGYPSSPTEETPAPPEPSATSGPEETLPPAEATALPPATTEPVSTPAGASTLTAVPATAAPAWPTAPAASPAAPAAVTGPASGSMATPLATGPGGPSAPAEAAASTEEEAVRPLIDPRLFLLLLAGVAALTVGLAVRLVRQERRPQDPHP
jgi:hypothetical protein